MIPIFNTASHHAIFGYDLATGPGPVFRVEPGPLRDLSGLQLRLVSTPETPILAEESPEFGRDWLLGCSCC